MQIYQLEKIKEVMKDKEYEIFEKGNYNINTIGIRSILNDESGEVVPDVFNDVIYVFYKINNEWNIFHYPCTTVPGKWYMQHPINEQWGTAIMVPGQYPGSHALGMHMNKPALVQIGKIKLYRDKNKDDHFDLDPSTIQDVNWVGCNIHYSVTGIQTIGRWSAGCQVLPYSSGSKEFESFLGHYRKAMTSGYPNSFTYTLLQERDFE